ncbi:MAG: right-handed parallel beta-helix repeat-containing protein [Candidatus Tenebribacter burtonii]|nr:right-handed parallel beta-helix repeat-containing protein [Candidatus Tenebribacter burtonii]
MKWIVIVILLFLFNILSSQTTIPAGDVSGMWDLAGSPYLIEGDISILETLNIEPGVTIIFQDHYELNVGFSGINGQLLAIGTEQDSILFTCVDPDIGWGGLRFETALSYLDSSKIMYCHIEYGKATGTGNDTKGGAIYCNSFSEVELAYCNITNNYTEHSNGGAIYLENSEPLIHHLKIQNNENGGIFSNDNSASLSNSEILNNTEYGVSQFYQLEESIVDGHDNVGVKNTNFIGNCIVSNNNYGIQNSLNIDNCTISNNYYGIYSNPEVQHTDVVNCIVVNNTNAIYTSDIEVNVINSLIANNTHGIYSYGYFYSPDANILNCTIVNNSNCGIYIFWGEIIREPSRNACNILNTILWSNGGNDISTILYFVYQVNVDFSCIEDELQSSIIIGDNCINNCPLFVDPTPGSGINYNALNADWSLSSNSLCINHGTPDTTGMNIPEYDLAGNLRIYQGNNPRIDIGAYEFQGEPDPIPEIEIIPDELNFGSWLVNNYSEIFESNIYNIGFAQLVIDSITAPEGFFIKRPDDPDFVSTIPSFSIDIDDDEQLQAIFLPEFVIAYNDSIKVYSNDPDEYISTIAVSGEGTIIDTTIQGNISEDIIIENDIYVVGSVTIVNGFTLTILPGVNVIVTGKYSINVQGRILAEGTEQDTILFYREDNLWGGINFIQTPASNDSSKFSYCKITKAFGGAIDIDSFDKVLISNCYIRNNRRTDHGGAIFCTNSELSIKKSNITRNLAINYDDYPTWGGAIYLENSYLKLSHCIISRNYVYGDGEWSGGAGAGMYMINSSCDMSDCEIYGNYSVFNGGPSRGGGLMAYDSQLEINNTIIRDNDMSCGAGIYVDDCNLFIRNSSFFDNISPNPYEGDGIACGGDSYVEIINTSLCNNYGYGFFGGGDNLYFINCIFQGNYFNQIRISGGYSGHGITTADLEYNCIENGLNGITISNPDWVIFNWLEGNIEDDPLFVDPENNDFHFLAESPCINAGTPDTTGLNLPEYDLDGNQRIYEDIIDMGCYEWQGTPINNEELVIRNYELTNFPNPFNPSTTIQFSIPQESEVELTVYNIKGQKVKTIVDATCEMGINTAIWYGINNYGNKVGTGIYFYQLKVDGKAIKTKKMMLIK